MKLRGEASLSLRVEKDGDSYRVRGRSQDDGSWDTDAAPATRLDDTEKLEIGGKSIPYSCALAIDGGGVLIEMPVGSSYRATSIYGQGWGEYKSETGYLLMTIQGFQVDGHDLYPLSGGVVVEPSIGPPPMKMGLWEVALNLKGNWTESSNGKPKVRRTEEETETIRKCITLDRWRPSIKAPDDSSGCVRTNELLTEKRYSVDVTCAFNYAVTHYDMDFETNEDGHVKDTTTYSPPGEDPSYRETTGVMKFISSDCGAVTPGKPQLVTKSKEVLK
ncbi:DUF3617 family protein [Granulicella arctica]|uniref:Uncharacterized protein n=1 Tax=Granulicella arctica TaxID=940613 RepID=A0A7Y9PGD7_9BACT|nr:DUF3617 family protein [Granulicella arctica]NYF78648.1 hypothetical protein [Granulicella arctica]